MNLLDLLKAKEAVMAFPEASFVLFIGGLCLGTAITFYFSRRELKIYRFVLSELRQPNVSQSTKEQLLNSAFPKHRFGVIVKSIGTTLIAAATGAIVAFVIVPQIPAPWKLTPQQAADLKLALAFSPEKIVFPISIVPGAGKDAISFGYAIMNIVGASPGWGAHLNLIDGEFDPSETGLRIAVKARTDCRENEKAMLLKSIFEKAGFQPRCTGDHQLPAGAAKLVIGSRP